MTDKFTEHEIDEIAKKVRVLNCPQGQDPISVDSADGKLRLDASIQMAILIKNLVLTSDEKQSLAEKVKAIVLELEKHDTDPEVPQAVRLGMNREWWTPDRKKGLGMVRWSDYRKMLISQGKPSPVVENLDRVTDAIMDCIEDPSKPGKWAVKGMVVGNVQSGKTQNYLGLASKAFDAGYKLVIILAGLHDSLRVQTQNRVDQGLVGLDSGKTANEEHGYRVGIGLDFDLVVPALETATVALRNGDFKIAVANNIWNRNRPTVMVVKKHSSVLNNVAKWVSAFDAKPGGIDVPVLIIDDEADNASIDIAKKKKKTNANNLVVDGSSDDLDEQDPSRINARIRAIIAKFNRTTYVGYTATPFANVLQNPDARHSDLGDDLFAGDFIVKLAEPDNYIGAVKVFGLGERVGGLEPRDPLPGLIRITDDARDWLPAKHQTSYFVQHPDKAAYLPDSLREAICSFALTGAIRDLRESKATPNSMLIHVSPWNLIQSQLKDTIKDFLDEVKVTLLYGQGVESEIWDTLSRLRNEYAINTQWYLENEDYYKQTKEIPDWVSLKPALANFIDRVQLKLINGDSSDVIDYQAHPSTAAIVLGGNKLSRGLTLEGLSVSYYLRESGAYDTLFQMGRWFGYRDGYVDLCRLYATQDLVEDFADITVAAEELYASFEELAQLGDKTPRDFALKVRSHPGRLKVTAAQKSQGAIVTDLNYSGTISETTVFNRTSNVLDTNKKQLMELLPHLVELDDSGLVDSSYSVYQTGLDPILNFLDGYLAHKSNYRVQPQALLDYIRSRQTGEPELTTWHVLIASPEGNNPLPGVTLPNGEAIRMVERTANKLRGSDASKFAFARLVTPEHELYDCAPGSSRWQEALELTQALWRAKQKNPSASTNDPAYPTKPIPKASRLTRSANIGLLMIYVIDPSSDVEYRIEGDGCVGFAISFPQSGIEEPINYVLHPYFEELIKGQ
jgi:hypothetical protein